MLRPAHKLTHRDFRQRIKRVDPHFYRTGNCVQMDARLSRPIGASLLGFAWAYLVISISGNRDFLEQSLAQGALASQHQDWIMTGLGVFIAVSLVMYGAHLIRFLFQSGARRMNSGGLLIGSLAALMLIVIPPEAWKGAFEMLDDNTQNFLITAGNSVDIDMPEVDLSDISLVSSRGN